MVDAAVSKTVGYKHPCQFDSDLRHWDPFKKSALSGFRLAG